MAQIAVKAEYFNILPSGGWMPEETWKDTRTE